jgi:hypothetical protein
LQVRETVLEIGVRHLRLVMRVWGGDSEYCEIVGEFFVTCDEEGFEGTAAGAIWQVLAVGVLVVED